ncbi:hypothetical protein FHX15_000326 [Rhizobium sp. BK650]|nr:hypothetical protein [Rhizobium sp. BK650]
MSFGSARPRIFLTHHLDGVGIAFGGGLVF